MAIACPYCEHKLSLKTPKPGSYKPRCPNCVKPFALVIPTEVGAAFKIRALANIGSDARAVNSHQLSFVKTTPDRRVCRSESQVVEPSTSEKPNLDQDYAPPRTDVRGYRIERELGRGGMGAVFLARQLSLDRSVALKVMSKRWASDPVFVARFTREAYAAAQLSHPNIVQIHDIGEVDGSRFFSMEFVPGQSLAELVRRHGKLDPETAVGYVLQAARGLKHAHARGMIHRDVKPDNLLLDEQGLVKVADLGLVKTRNSELCIRCEQPEATPAAPNTGLTEAKIALGTPAYMSPEQCRDAAAVDHRADIYSLGCTLYVLVTGKPPYDGTTAVELMTKHAYEPLVPPERLVARVPKELSSIIQRMMAKNPDDRFANASELIRALEAWLGVRTAGTFAPTEEQIDRLEAFAVAYHDSSKATLRTRFLKGFFIAVALASVLLLFTGKLAWAAGVVGLAAQFTFAYFLIDGIARKGALFTRFRQFAFGLGWCDWAVSIAGLALFGILLGMLGVFWISCGFGLLGVGLAFALRFGIDRKLDAERRPAIDGCEKLLRRLRAQGLDEEDLRGFVAKFAGRHWEALFEAIFGYDAKLNARASLVRGGSSGPREKHAPWREPLIALIERVEKNRKDARERKLLTAVEQARLQAAGATQHDAEDKAKAAAEAMVREADKIRKAEVERVRIRNTPQAAHAAPVQVANLARGGSNPDFMVAPRTEPNSGFIGLFVGLPVRALLASVLLACFGLWVNQNGLMPGTEVQAQATAAVESNDLSELEQTATAKATRSTHPLEIEDIPAPATEWIDSINVGLAGLLLLCSLFYRGNAMGTFIILGAGIAALGHHCGIRAVEPMQGSHIALMLGAVLALIGFRNAR